MKLRSGVIVLALFVPVAGLGGRGAGDAVAGNRQVSGSHRILICATERDHALAVPGAGNGVKDFTLEGARSKSIATLVNRMHDPWALPRDRPIEITLYGNVIPTQRDALVAGVSDLGALVRDEPDTLEAVARRGPARVIWYSDHTYLAMAEFIASRSSVIYGQRYVALGDVSDYVRLESEGAIVPEVMALGGRFPIAEQRSGWQVTHGDQKAPEAKGPIAGLVRVVEARDVNREASKSTTSGRLSRDLAVTTGATIATTRGAALRRSTWSSTRANPPQHRARSPTTRPAPPSRRTSTPTAAADWAPAIRTLVLRSSTTCFERSSSTTASRATTQRSQGGTASTTSEGERTETSSRTPSEVERGMFWTP